ncbi:MAG TPA: diaminopimelate epimerase [Actinomycetota bacterium]|nr:diaminopimelate epimerase [Actinomycetota bacterium]
MSSRRIAFTKGHGTGNDFVLVADPADELRVSGEGVRAVCDRRFGLGADGLIRAVLAGDEWFMDYRNADGSIGEMCGNGARVFAAFLWEQMLVAADDFTIVTRGGRRQVSRAPGGISVDMGVPRRDDAEVEVVANGRSWPARAVFMPNPHAVVFVDDLDDPGPLREAPRVRSAVFPEGQNVEFVLVRNPGEHVAMRVHERGVGETLSCGTGVCAVADRALERAGVTGPASIRVDVPGGSLTVDRTSGGTLVLTGPAELVAEGTLSARLSEMFL